MDNHINEQMAQQQLEEGYSQAAEILKDKDALGRFLQRLEKKLRIIPLAGSALASIPVLVSLIKSFAKKEFTDIPVGSIIAITSALIYFLSPVDIIPDVIPGLELFDDALVVTACLKLVESDVEEYMVWRKENGKEIQI